MPMAKKNLNTVARLAMGTAMLTVISGCETRVGQGFSELISPITGADATTQTAGNVPGYYIPESTVVAPEYVTPGVPTYVESSQAANVQTFETVYGPPVVDAASGTLTASNSYTVPSYNDGTVLSQPLAAPTATAAPEIASYSQSIPSLPPATYTSEPSYGLASVAADSLIYGESVSTESYTSAPMPAPTMVAIEEPMAAPMTSAATESYSYESSPMLEAEVMMSEPAMMMPESAPMMEVESAAFTVPAAEPMMASEQVLIAEPVMESKSFMVEEPMMVPASAPALEPMAMPAPATPMSMPVNSGFEIISNDEAEAVFGGEPMSKPLEPSVFDAPAPISDLGGQFQITPQEEPLRGTMSPILGEAPSMGIAEIEVAALSEMRVEPQPLPQIAASPVPRPKAIVVTSTLAAVDRGPTTAPAPRRRPSVAERSYATLNAPLPQPRPNYKKPVAMATSAGNYVSIGALPSQPSFGAPKIADSGMLPADATNGNAMSDATANVEVASVRIPEPKAPALARPASKTKASELSGTSWRLVEIDATQVSVNAELHFDGSSGFAGGQGPCNSYGGEFMNVGKGRFSMADIFSTEIECSSIDVEKRYIGALENAQMYKIAPGFSDLTLIDAGGKEVARFKAF